MGYLDICPHTSKTGGATRPPNPPYDWRPCSSLMSGVNKAQSTLWKFYLCKILRSLCIDYLQGLDSAVEGISLISKVIEDELSIPCHVLMGANLAGEVAQEMFVEATIGNRIIFSLHLREQFRIEALLRFTPLTQVCPPPLFPCYLRVAFRDYIRFFF